MKTNFTNSYFNKTFKMLMAFCMVLLMSIDALAQVTATEDFENETTLNNTTPHNFSEGGISFSSTTTYQKIPTPTFGYNNSTAYIVIAGASVSRNITITNASTSFKINSFASYVGSNANGSTATNGSITFVGTLVGGGTVTATVNVASTGTVPSGQTRETNLMVDGLSFAGTPLDGQFITSLSISTSASVQFIQLDHINFTTQAVVTNQFSINDVSQSEGNTGSTNFTFTVTRSNNTAASSVQVQSSDGTATSGSDYTAFPLTTVNFTAGGALTQTVNVAVLGDAAVELDETFTMTLSNPTGGVLLDASGTGTILDDDAINEPFDDETEFSPIFTQIGNNFQTTGKLIVRKNGGNLGAGNSSGYASSSEPFAVGNQGSLQLTSAGKSFNVISVDLWAAAVSGSSPSLVFTATNCTITFTGTKADGSGTVTHTAAITPSGTNTFSSVNFAGSPLANVQLSAIAFSTPTGIQYLQIDNFKYGITTLTNTQLSIDDVSVIEGTGSGSTTATFTVTRTNNTTAFTVNVASSDGTATAGTDYTALPSTTLTFTSGGALTQTVNVTVLKDATIEPNETFNMTLSGATNGTVYLKQTGIGRILNDDSVIETFEDETNLATTFSESGASFSTSGGYRVRQASTFGSGSSNFYLSSTNNAVGNQGTFSLTTANKAFKLNGLDAWVGTTETSHSSGSVTFTGTLFGGGTVSTTRTITATSATGAGYQLNVTFTGTPLDNVLLTAIQVTTAGALTECDIDNFNYTLVNTLPVIEVVDDADVAVTNGAPAVLSGNTDFRVVCLTGRTGSKTFTIKNTGQSNLTLSGSPLAVLGGTNASEFSITTQPTSPIAPGGSTTFTVLFDPSVGGAKSASITLTSNDPTNSPYVINIRGAGGLEPTVTLGASPAICAGATSFTIPFSGLSANPTAYSVSGTGITPVINGSLIGLPSPFVINLSTPAVFGTNPSYTLSIINGNGCISPDYTGSVTVTEGPTATASSNSPVCAGSDLNLTGGGVGTYAWTGPNSFSSTDQSPSITNATTGATGIYTIRVTNANLCTSTATTSVTVTSLPSITTSASPAICAGASSFTIPYTATGTPTTYSISGTGITTVTNATLPATPITVNISDAGGATGSSYSYTLTVRNANGCVSSNVTGSVAVNPSPTIAVGTILPICAGATSFTIPYTGTTGTPTTYSISGAGITTVTNAALPASSITVNLSSGATGSSISFTLTVRNAGGCTSTNVLGSVPVNPLPTLTKSASPAICAGATSFTIPYTATTETPTTYSISGAGITTVTDATLPATPITVNLSSGATGSSISYILTVKNANGCTSSNITGSVTVNPLPTITKSVSPAICAGATTFTIPYTATTGTPTLYSISGSGITTVTDASLPVSPITVNLDGGASGSSISYILIVRNANGCLSNNVSGSVTVNSTPAPTAPTATPSSRTTAGSVTLSASGCSGGTLTWYNASTNVAVPSPNNQPNFTTSGTYNFYAKCTGTNTCESNASTNVSVAVTLCTGLASSPGNVGINWTGLESTDWNNPCNWSPAWVPDATNSAVVINLRTNQPTISGTVPSVKLIYVNSGATLTVSSGGTLNASVSGTAGVLTLQGGNLINDGTINVSGGGSGVGISIGAAANITNRGTINTNNLYGASLDFGNLTFTNESTGIFNGDFKANDNVLTLTNRGTINYGGGTYALSLGSAGSSVVNNGTISITGGSGISNPSGSTITNNACGKILMTTDLYENGGTTTNAGLIQMPNLYNFTNTGTFTNNGVLKANTVSGITNNRMVITNACPIFTLAGSNNYTVSGIFTDAGATTSAGTYVSVGNKFTANNTIPTGTQTLYAQVTNGTCTFVVPFNFNNVKPTSVSVNNTTICTGASVTLSASCASGTPTWYTTATGGSNIGTGASLSQSPTVATTYYVACEATNCVSGRVATNQVTVSSPPTASASSNSPICAGSTLSLTGGAAGNTYLWTGPNSFTSTELSPSILSATTLSTGTYTIRVTNASSCTSTATTAVTVNAAPMATASSNSPVCIGNSISLIGGGVGTYLWTGPNGYSSMSQSPTITNATASASGTYTITVTGAGNCTSTATTSVTVNNLITANVTPSTQTICSGEAITTIALSGTGTSYTWTRDNTGSVTGITASGSGNISGSLTNTTESPITVTFTITPVGSCNGTPTTATVIVNPTPTVTASTPSQSICSGATITGITFNNPPAFGPQTPDPSSDIVPTEKTNTTQAIAFSSFVSGTVFNWTRNNTTTVTGIPASGSGNISGSLTNTTTSPITVTFTVTPSYTNAGKTCTGTPITVTVTVNPNPTAAITDGGTAFCSGSSTTLTAPADPNYTYAWQRSLTGITTPNEFTAFGGTAQTQVVTTSGVYRVIVTNQYNCSARDTTAVKFGDFVFNGSLATGDAQQTGRMNRFAAVSTCAAPKGYPGDFTTTGSRLYDSYTVTNPTSAPVCATIGLTSGCGTSLFSAAYLGSFNPTSLGTNYLADHGSTFPNTAFYEVTIPANGTIVVVVHEVNPGTGCSNYNLRIDVPGATVAPTASSNSPICAGNTLNLTGTGTGTYAWTGPNNFTSSAQNPSINNATTLATGTYTISVTNTNNCVFNATTAVTVNATPMATASSSTPTICAGNTVSLTGGGIGTYAWAGPNTFTSSAQSPTIPNATTLATGTYTITVTNASNCSSTATVAVTVNAIPTATANSNSPVCAGNTVNLLGGGLAIPTLAPTGSYAWTGPNSFSSSLQNPSILSATTAATGTYQLIITNPNGCTAMATTSVMVNTLPMATASSNSPVCTGNTLNLLGGGLAIPTLAPTGSYAWTGPNSFSSSLQNPSIPSATTAAMGTYQLIITNANGCTAMATTSVTVNPLPTATASSNSPICSGAMLNLSASGGTSYTWTGPNSFSSTQQNPNIPSATALATGTYQVVVTNANGCTAMVTTSVTVNPTPVTPTPQANTQIIFGGSVTLTATGCSATNDVLKWYQSVDNTLVTMPVSPTVTSNYYAKCETTLNGITCISPQSTNVTVTVLSPTPPVATGGTTCIGTPLSLAATGCSGSTGTFELKWYQNSDNTLVTMPVSITATTDYYAKCEQTFNAITAVSEKSNVVTLTVLNPAVPVATGATIYNGNSATLTATGCTGEGFTLKWYQTTDNTLVTMPVSPTVTTQYYAKCEQTANSITCISNKSNDVAVTVVNRIFVDITKVEAPIQNGTSWATAYGNLHTGLAAATSGVEVWVAKGTYKTTTTLDRTIYFNIPNNVIVYGGFAGTENALSERNFNTNVSILSGEIGNQGIITDNSYHVVLLDGSSSNTVLDGFTITGGNANFNPNRTVNLPITTAPSTTTIESGGGIALANAAMPMIVNCTISNNSSVVGGGLYAGDASKPLIQFCKFLGNQAVFGSAIYLQDGSDARLSNILIAGNRGVGGLYNNKSNPTITNATFSGNGGYNGGIFNSNSQPVVKNSIFWGNATPFNDTQSTISNSIVQGGYPGTGNLNYDPQFVNQTPEGLSPILNGDYHLKASSLAIDRGDNGSISVTDLDLDGNLRRYNGGRVDMGAYEFQGNGTGNVIISIGSGDWEINSTWDLNRVPQIGDIVIIDQNHIVTLNGEANAKNVEYRGTGQLKFNSTNSKLNIGF